MKTMKSSTTHVIDHNETVRAHYKCDGHAHGTSAGLVDWATVCFIVIIDVDARAIHRTCLRHISIYST